jgi:hypothetical protein
MSPKSKKVHGVGAELRKALGRGVDSLLRAPVLPQTVSNTRSLSRDRSAPGATSFLYALILGTGLRCVKKLLAQRDATD